MAALSDARLLVAVGIITNTQGEILMAQRASHQDHPNLYEFPGGKFEPGETLAQALARELFEEIGVIVKAHRWLMDISHDYPNKKVHLVVHEVLEFEGTPYGKESQTLFWVPLTEIHQYLLPGANQEIINKLRNP